MIEIDRETLEIARDEAHDCLQRIEANLLTLEGGAPSAEPIDAVFRDAHSVKGAAAMVGWTATAAIARDMEDELEEARSAGRLDPQRIGPLLKASDDLRRAVDEEFASTSEVDSPSPSPSPPEAQRSLRVDPAKVDRMLDAVGETVLHHRRLEHIVGERIAGDELAGGELDRGERLLEELQEAVIGMRTLPLASVTAAFPRAVRDMAAAEGKQAELAILGGDTQLDRAILSGIADPVVHLLRNAVAHGIEPPDERERVGKDARGRLELRAEQRGGLVAVEVADDGRGVSPELLERAAEHGSLADILATAGMSTAVEVGELAGRGVGLDAVKVHVESLGGSVEVRSEVGTGTTVTLLLPVTLAVINVLLCERDGQAYGLPVPSVREIVTVDEVASLAAQPRFVHRGEALPLGDLATLLGAVAPELPRRPPAVVLASATRAMVVACDRVLGDRELVVKSLGGVLSGVSGYLGAGVLEDGRVALILDPNRLLDLPAAAGGDAEIVPAPPETGPAPLVLVVDDQFSVRRLQSSILEAAGYRVDTAKHGREALQKIVSGPEFDLVLTDMQMPEMDGLELLRAIRENGEHESLPVAIVTSKASEDDRRRGAEAGADAYIVKQEFNQQALLETIERLVGG
jgi:two-component system chemotaxis sensor kinase CheA